MPRKKGKGGRGRAVKPKSAEPEPEEEGPAIIRCICGYEVEDENDTRPMICCDKCLAWQHNVCMGMPTDDDDLPDQYFCEKCKPDDHKELLDGIARGEKPWETRQEEYEREEEEKKSRKREGGRKPKKSAKAAEAEADANGTAADSKAEATHKRKVPADLNVEIPSETGSNKTRKVATPKDPKSASSVRRPSMASPSHARRDSLKVPLQAELVENIDELNHEVRRRAAKALERLFIDQTATAIKQGAFKMPVPQQTTAEFGLRMALKVEYAMYLNLWGHSSEAAPAYGEKLRTVLHNVKANPALRDRLLNGTLPASDFSKMSSKDMQSKEKAEENAQLIKEAEKRHIMVQEEGPRIRRTHKGDEIIADDSHITASESVFSNAPRRRESEADGDARSPITPNTAEMRDVAMSPTSGRPLMVDTRHKDRRSSSFVNTDWSNIESPTALHKYENYGSGGGRAHGRSGVKADPEIDNLLKEEDDDEPYSPMDYEMEPGVVWRGSVLMPAVAEFRGSAKYVAGADLSSVYPWQTLMPSPLTIEGRIDVEQASTYLCSLRWSKSIDVTVVAVTPADSEADRDQFDKLFAYFTERKRYGVVNTSPVSQARDIYVIPVEAGSTPRPDFIELLQDCSLEMDRPNRVLLVTYVIKVRGGTGGGGASSAAAAASATPQRSAMSPGGLAPPQSTGTPSVPSHISPVGSAVQQQGMYPPPSTQSPRQAHHQPPNPAHHANPNFPTGQQSPAPTGWEAAAQVLGPNLGEYPVLKELLRDAPATGVKEFGFIRDAFVQLPETRRDVAALMAALSARMNAGG